MIPTTPCPPECMWTCRTSKSKEVSCSLHRSVDNQPFPFVAQVRDNQPYFLAHGLVQADRPERGCPVLVLSAKIEHNNLVRGDA
jgi:hypothetical protein